MAISDHPLFIFVGVFVFVNSLYWIMLRIQRPGRGYFTGIGIFIILYWLIIKLVFPTREQCLSGGPLSCEWLFAGYISLITSIGILTLSFTSLAVILRVFYFRWIFRVKSDTRPKEIPTHYKWNLFSLSMLVAMTILGGWLGYQISLFTNQGRFIPWNLYGESLSASRAYSYPAPTQMPTLQPYPGYALNEDSVVGETDIIQTIVRATTKTLIIETKDGKYHSGSVDRCTNNPILCWELRPGTTYRKQIPLFQACKIEFFPPSPPANTIEMVKTRECNSSRAIQINYAIREDGTVWYWLHEIDPYDFNKHDKKIVLGTLSAYLVSLFGLVVFDFRKSNMASNSS